MKKITALVLICAMLACNGNGERPINKQQPLQIPPIWSKHLYDINGPIKMSRLIRYNDSYETPTGWAPIEKTIMLDEYRYFNINGNIDSIISTTYNDGLLTIKVDRTPNPAYGIMTIGHEIVGHDTIDRINPFKSVTRRYNIDGELIMVETRVVDSLGRVISHEKSYLGELDRGKKTSFQFEYRNGVKHLIGGTDVNQILKHDKYNNPLETITISNDGYTKYDRFSYQYYE